MNIIIILYIYIYIYIHIFIYIYITMVLSIYFAYIYIYIQTYIYIYGYTDIVYFLWSLLSIILYRFKYNYLYICCKNANTASSSIIWSTASKAFVFATHNHTFMLKKSWFLHRIYDIFFGAYPRKYICSERTSGHTMAVDRYIYIYMYIIDKYSN